MDIAIMLMQQELAEADLDALFAEASEAAGRKLEWTKEHWQCSTVFMGNKITIWAGREPDWLLTIGNSDPKSDVAFLRFSSLERCAKYLPWCIHRLQTGSKP